VGSLTSDSAGENLVFGQRFAATTGWDLDRQVRCSNHGQQKAVEVLARNPRVARVIRKANQQETIVNMFNCNSGRYSELQKACRAAGLPVYKIQPANATRWGSTFRLLQDILPCGEEQWQTWLHILDSFNLKFATELQLKEVDWSLQDFKDVRDIRALLCPFREVMVEGQASKEPTLNWTIHNYNFLIASLQPDKVPAWLQPTAAVMTEKLQEYQGYLGAVHQVATCLDPTMKLLPFHKDGREKYMEVRDACISKLAKYFHAPVAVQTRIMPPAPPSLARRAQREDPGRLSPKDWLLSTLSGEDIEASIQNRDRAMAAVMQEPPEELLQYLRDPVAPQGTNVLEWWRANKGTYPKLWKAARDILAGQSSSAAVERVFSYGRMFCGIDRQHLLPETVRASLIMHHWFQEV
jgi:hypothetical protein